jgi:hypothetical protein
MYTRIDPTTENRSPQHASVREPQNIVENPRSDTVTQLQSIANNSAQVNRLQTFQLMANAHSEKQEVAQLQELADDSDSVMQLKAIKGGSALTGTVKYTTKVNNGIDSAYLMEAKNIKPKNLVNPQLASGNGPAADPPGWTAIQNLGITKNAPFYKRMHLLNGDLGGSGTDVENLAPGSADLNTAHYTEIEDTLQNHVLGGGEISSYEVWAFYRDKGLKRFSNTTEDAYKHSLVALHCQYVLDTGAKDSKTIYEDAKTAKNWPN